jgi:hypothetical protein
VGRHGEKRVAVFILEPRGRHGRGRGSEVSHAGGRPILFFDRSHNPELPTGSVDVVTADGHAYEFDFVKVAVNVARRGGEPGNRLPELLRSWFGDDAGHAGTGHRVQLTNDPDGTWRLRPLGMDDAPGLTSTEAGA